MVGGKLAYMVTQRGVIVAWDCGTAHLHDAAFHDLIADFHDTMVVINRHWLSCSNRRSTQLEALQTRHLKRTHGVGNRVIHVDDDLPLQTEPPPHVGAVYVLLAFTMAMINVLVQWDRLPPDDMV
jgi:hypothetical protein